MILMMLLMLIFAAVSLTSSSLFEDRQVGPRWRGMCCLLASIAGTDEDNHENSCPGPAPWSSFLPWLSYPHLLSNLNDSSVFRIAPFQRLIFLFHFTRGKWGDWAFSWSWCWSAARVAHKTKAPRRIPFLRGADKESTYAVLSFNWSPSFKIWSIRVTITTKTLWFLFR